ncbi:la-related protein 7-like [Patiria miniata]|uniref:La-related protein 7 n=1 Tax=Patiria miniata TaxID=46514 RepID=A0A914ADK1_PATMI|nr:la-related protein 7-like [Patiria miniata]
MNGQSGPQPDATDSGQDKKKKRQRLKKLQADIKQQVEFYFSDANLRKDRFLRQEIDKSEDRYVDIATVANFNRMQNLTQDQALIARALGKSEALVVSEDKTRIRRTNPIEEPKYNIDDVTVYVENLPHNVDHDMLSKAFSACGTVAYISLPRYKGTGDPKKFAFIEFSTPEGAAKACKLLNNPPRDKPDPDGHFPTTRKGRLILPEQAAVSKQQGNGKKSEKQVKQKATKRKREASKTEETSQDAEREQINKKKGRVKDDKEASASKRKRDVSEGTEEDAHDRTQLEKKTKRKSEASQDMVTKKHDQLQLRDEDKNKDKKDSRKRKHSGGDSAHERSSHGSKNHEARSHKGERSDPGSKGDRSDHSVKDEKSAKDSSTTKKAYGSETHKRKRENSNGSVDSLKVKSSLPGHHRDNKDYVEDGQDAKRRRTESEMMEEEGNKKRKKRSRSRRNKKEDGNAAPMMQLSVIPKKKWLVMKEEYLALQKASRQQMKQTLRKEWAKGTPRQELQQCEQKASIQAPPEVKSTEPGFHAGVVLKIRSEKPFESRKELREQLEQISPVAYIELNSGDTDGFVRLQSAEGAQAVLGKASKLSNDGGPVQLNLLSGQDEQNYWEKLRADRIAKLTTKKRKPKKRGVERIKDKAKRDHIMFGGDE